MLLPILFAQTNIPSHSLPNLLKVTPTVEPRFNNLPQKQQIQQLQENLNANQKDYELKIRQLETLPSSRIDCYPRFPPIQGVDRFSCKRP